MLGGSPQPAPAGAGGAFSGSVAPAILWRRGGSSGGPDGAADLYWAPQSRCPVGEGVFAYSTDDKQEFAYEPFNRGRDFGPLDISRTVMYCRWVDALCSAHAGCTALVHIASETSGEDRANTVALCGAYLVLAEGATAEEAFRPFAEEVLPPFRDCRGADAPGSGIADEPEAEFELTVLDVLQGLEHARNRGWLNYHDFSVEEHSRMLRPENGDMGWLLPRKALALASPWAEPKDQDGLPVCTPTHLSTFLRENCVAMVVQCNRPDQEEEGERRRLLCYDSRDFEEAGIRHLHLPFEDGGCPSVDILLSFLDAAHAVGDSSFAVHCRSGLGRTATLIGAYAMQNQGFDARSFIGWVRVVRPGTVHGSQQQYLCNLEAHVRPVPQRPLGSLSHPERLALLPRRELRFWALDSDIPAVRTRPLSNAAIIDLVLEARGLKPVGASPSQAQALASSTPPPVSRAPTLPDDAGMGSSWRQQIAAAATNAAVGAAASAISGGSVAAAEGGAFSNATTSSSMPTTPGPARALDGAEALLGLSGMAGQGTSPGAGVADPLGATGGAQATGGTTNGHGIQLSPNDTSWGSYFANEMLSRKKNSLVDNLPTMIGLGSAMKYMDMADALSAKLKEGQITESLALVEQQQQQLKQEQQQQSQQKEHNEWSATERYIFLLRLMQREGDRTWDLVDQRFKAVRENCRTAVAAAGQAPAGEPMSKEAQAVEQVRAARHAAAREAEAKDGELREVMTQLREMELQNELVRMKVFQEREDRLSDTRTFEQDVQSHEEKLQREESRLETAERKNQQLRNEVLLHGCMPTWQVERVDKLKLSVAEAKAMSARHDMNIKDQRDKMFAVHRERQQWHSSQQFNWEGMTYQASHWPELRTALETRRNASAEAAASAASTATAVGTGLGLPLGSALGSTLGTTGGGLLGSGVSGTLGGGAGVLGTGSTSLGTSAAVSGILGSLRQSTAAAGQGSGQLNGTRSTFGSILDAKLAAGAAGTQPAAGLGLGAGAKGDLSDVGADAPWDNARRSIEQLRDRFSLAVQQARMTIAAS